MTGTGSENRHRIVLLPETVSEAERRRLRDRLLELDAVEGVTIDGRQCRITYAFPDITFAAIRSRLQKEIHSPFPLFNRLRCDVVAVMEENERDYRLQPCGWHYYLQHIHARRFDPRHTGGRDNRKQQWQQYSGRKRGATANNGPVQSGS
ncbi:MAG: hypothetical protein WD750_08495 [Gammaproteobacteria bacterium]